MPSTTNTMDRVVDHATVVDQFRRVQDEVGGLVGATKPSRLNAPTPCRDWDARALLNHMVHINLLYAAMADQKKPPPMQDFLADDPGNIYRSAARVCARAFSRGGMLEQTYPSPWGEIPGAVLVQHVAIELLVHGWDLAKATGRPTDLLPDLVPTFEEIYRAWFGETVERKPENYATEKPAPADASAADRLAAFLGRDV